MGSDLLLQALVNCILRFNPRSHVGSDRTKTTTHYVLKRFNPRSHVGSDWLRYYGVHCRKVSIHAPTWGATGACACSSASRACFNPRSHVGSDVPYFSTFSSASLFQSTLPRGERHNGTRWQQLTLQVSIHAPTWGATCCQQRIVVSLQVSIHAPTWGATPEYLSDEAQDSVSIHAPTWGATLNLSEQIKMIGVSIHAPTWGATIYPPFVGFWGKVSIHAPTWGATLRLLQ